MSVTPMQKLFGIDMAPKALAQCAYKNRKGRQCKYHALPGGRRCQKHIAKTHGRKPILGMYSQALQNSPTFLQKMEEIKATNTYKKMDDDLVLLRTMLNVFMEKNQEMVANGDPSFIAFINSLIEKISNLIEKIEGRKYVVTLNGIQVIIDQVVAVVTLHLQHDPDRLTLIANDLSKIRLPPGALGK